jgi:hypothetical protein
VITCKKNDNSVYLGMSRALDRLIITHRRDRKPIYVRHYSEIEPLLKDIDKLEKLLEEARDESPETIKVLDTYDEIADNLLGISEKELPEIEEDLSQGNEEEKRGYRNRILHRIYSDIERISGSRRLERKLISYYLKHRRRDKMRRLYGKRNNYYSRNSVDHLLHDMYMELGRTLYFSWLGKLRDLVKDKVLRWPVVKDIVHIIKVLGEKANEIMSKIKQGNILEALAMLFGVSGGLSAFLYMISLGILSYLGWHETGGGPWEDWIATIAYNLVVIVGLIAAVFVSAIIAYFAAKAFIAAVKASVKSIRRLLRPKAIKVYIKAIKLLYTLLPALSSLLSKKMNLESTFKLFGNFVDASTGNKEAQKQIYDSISNLSKARGQVKDYVTLDNERDLWKILTKGSGYEFQFSIEVADFVKSKIGDTFKVGSHLESDYFVPKPHGNVTDLGLPTNKELPIELAILIAFTSPNITLRLKAGSSEAAIRFKALAFFTTHSNSSVPLQDSVEKFLDAYMEAFAETRGELSEIFAQAYEKKEHEK